MKTLLLLKILVVVFAIIIIGLLAALFFYNPANGPAATSSPVMPAASAALVSPDGALTIATSSLSSDATVSSPLALAGTVTGGGWFFEGTFPVKIVDSDGAVLGSTTARADGDWMSTGTVPWNAELVFTMPRGTTGTVIFQNDNPSVDPAQQKTFSVPVIFAP